MLNIIMSLCATALCHVPELSERTPFAIGEVGFAVVSAVQSAEREGFAGTVLAADGGVVVAVVSTDSGENALPTDTVFEIASVTKQFTAAAIMLLAQEGKLTLDDPIADHLPGVPDDCRDITIRHLLTHTSGIPGTNSQGAGNQLELVLPSFLRGGPKHEPGTHWEYWNQGYALLSEIIARAAGEPYTAYLRRALFEPAGMNQTMFTGDAPPDGLPVALGSSRRGNDRSALDHPYGSYGFQYRGMGGIVSNVWDLWRWDRALAGHTLLTDESSREYFEPGLNGYALGWFIRESLVGRSQQHGGAVRGFTADLRRYPDRDAFIVVLCSTDGYPATAVAESVEQAMFTPANEAAKSKEVVEQLALLSGRYVSDRGNALVIPPDINQDRVNARIVWAAGFPDTRAVIRVTDNGLSMSDGSGTYPVTITLAEGIVTEVAISIGRGEPMRFNRVADE